MSETLTSEQLALVQKNLANKLIFQYLVSDSHSAEAADAFDGLVALCFKAKGNLAIYPTNSEQQTQRSIHRITREAIEDILLGILAPYHGKTELEIFETIQQDKFRYIGRGVRSRLIDKIRHRQALKNKEVPTIHTEKVSEISVTPETTLDGNQTSARQDNNSKYAEFLGESVNAKALREIGKEAANLIDAAISLYPQTYEEGSGQIKSALTEALARREGIEDRTAREQKSKAREQIQKADASGNKPLADLYGLISKGDDKHTLRDTHISPDGKRKRHTVLRQVRFASKKCDTA